MMDTKYKLASYYERVFFFRSLDGLRTRFYVDGNACDIHKLTIDAEKEYTLKELLALNWCPLESCSVCRGY